MQRNVTSVLVEYIFYKAKSQTITFDVFVSGVDTSFERIEYFFLSSRLYDVESASLHHKNIKDYKIPDVSIGYRFRLQPVQNRFLYDIDIVVGFKGFKAKHIQYDDGSTLEPTDVSVRTYSYFSLSLAPSCSYRFIANLYVGAGLHPTIYNVNGLVSDNRVAKYKFDLPVTLKAGYDFKYFDLSLNYSFGLFNIAGSEYIAKAMIYNWQAQVFIPF